MWHSTPVSYVAAVLLHHLTLLRIRKSLTSSAPGANYVVFHQPLHWAHLLFRPNSQEFLKPMVLHYAQIVPTEPNIIPNPKPSPTPFPPCLWPLTLLLCLQRGALFSTFCESRSNCAGFIPAPLYPKQLDIHRTLQICRLH